jgi:hypothetical protein
MSETTTVNDNTVKFGVTAHERGDDVHARRFAADLERNDERVDRVNTSVTNYATVWLADGDTKFEAPEGYEITGVFVGSNGGVAVKIDTVDA